MIYYGGHTYPAGKKPFIDGFASLGNSTIVTIIRIKDDAK